MEYSEGVVFVDACQVDDIHPVDRRKIGAMVPLETFFGDWDHFLHWDVESAANSLEQTIDDVVINHKYVSVDANLNLQVFVFAEKNHKEIS